LGRSDRRTIDKIDDSRLLGLREYIDGFISAALLFLLIKW
jgi:hypothetical protein